MTREAHSPPRHGGRIVVVHCCSTASIKIILIESVGEGPRASEVHSMTYTYDIISLFRILLR